MRCLLFIVLLPILLLTLLNAVPLALARAFIYERQNEVPSKDTGLVLGAGLKPDGQPSSILKARLETALRLFRARKVHKLILSGDSSGPWYNEVSAMRKYLLARGMKPEDLLLDPAGHNTFDSIRHAKKLQVGSLIIFSQQYHLPRAVFLARAMDLDAVGFASDQHISPHRWWYEWREIWARPLAIYALLFS